MIAGYMGASGTFDDAIGEFAVDCADQNERDYRGFVRAVKEGRIQATADIQTNLLSREPLHDLDQFPVCVAGGIAEFAGRVRVGEPAQPQQLAQPLAPIEL